MFRFLRHYSLPVLLAIGLHAGLVLLLIGGVQADSAEARVIRPPIVNATLLVVEPKTNKPITPPTPAPIVEPAPAPVAAPEPEPAPITPKADKVDPRLLEDKRRRAEEAKKQLALAKKEAEQKQRERDERKVKEREEAERLQAERIKAAAARAEKEKQERLDALASSSLAQEKAAQEQADAQSAEAAASFFQGIRAKIVSNWSRPASARNGMKVTLQVDLVPTGEVAGVALVDSSGDTAFDRSAELAVRKAGRFEVPTESAVFERRFRRFNLLFNPEDLLR